MDVFKELLKSKQLWVMLITAVVTWLVSIVPALDAVRSQLQDVFLVLGAILVGGYSVADTAKEYGEAQVKAYTAKSQLVSAQNAGIPMSQSAAREAYERTKDR
jgi:hypothetical protein